MIKPDLGTKRVCPSCAARFYDLQKRPIECPKCAFTFEPDALLRQRRPRTPDATQEEAADPQDANAENENDGEAGVAAESGDKELLDSAANDQEETTGPGMSVSDEADQDVDEDDEDNDDDDLVVSLDDDEDDDSLLEEDDNDLGDDDLDDDEDDDDDDVSTIIDADIEKDES